MQKFRVLFILRCEAQKYTLQAGYFELQALEAERHKSLHYIYTLRRDFLRAIRHRFRGPMEYKTKTLIP